MCTNRDHKLTKDITLHFYIHTVDWDYVINLMYLLSFPADAALRNYKAINENCHMHIIQKYIQCQSYHSDIRLLLC